MVQVENQQLATVDNRRWTGVGAISGLIGSTLLAIIAIALHTSLTEAQYAIVNPVGAVAMVLMAFALPVLYLSERHWFGSLARVGFGVMAVGWIVTTVMLVLFALGWGLAGLMFVPGVFVAMIGAFVFGIAMIRSDETKMPRIGAWLLIAALPLGLPISIAYMSYVLGFVDGFWNGPLVLYALAWIVFSYSLWGRRKESAVAESIVS